MRASLFIAGLLVSTSAYAQAVETAPIGARALSPSPPQSASPDEGALRDIVVTARRQSESIQRTPIAVTAFTAEAITRSAAPDLRGLANQAPNVNLQAGANAGGGNNTQIFIRGVGQDDFLPSVDPGVGVYVDGVYLGRSVGGLLKTSDLSQIEVLRGPQGTLFGRNTIGGAINIRTTDPNFSRAEGYVEGVVGNDDLYAVNAALGGPLADGLAFRISGGYRSHGGYGRSQTDGTEFGNENYGLVRGKLGWKATDRLTINLSGDYYKQRQNNNPVAVLGLVCADGTVGVCPNIPETSLPNVLPSGLISLYNNFVGVPNGRPFTNADLRPRDDPFNSAATGPSRDDAKVWGLSTTIDYKLSNAVSLKSITAYRKLDAFFSSDNDGGAALVADTTDVFKQHQFSQEFQAVLTTERLKGVLGAYYFREVASDVNTVNITPGLYNQLEAFPLLVGSSIASPPGAPGVPCSLVTFASVPGTAFVVPINAATGAPAGGLGCARNFGNTFLDNQYLISQSVGVRNFALFGQGTYQVTDKLSITAGLRYTHERKQFVYAQQRLGVSAALGTPYYAVPPTTAHDTFSNVSPRIGAEYRLSNRVLSYVSYARGFKSGAFNGRSTSSQGVKSVKPETVDQFEAGLKSQFADNHIRLNLAGFYSIYQDIQLQSVVSDPAAGLLINLINAGKARIYGAELELLARPVRGLELGLNGGYLHTRIIEIDPVAAASTGVVEGNQLKKSPKWNFTASAQYTMPLGTAGDLQLRGEYRYVGRQFHDAANNPDTVEDAYGLVNGRIAFTTTKKRYTLAAYGRNLTNKTYYNSLFRTGGGETIGYPARGREYGASLRASF